MLNLPRVTLCTIGTENYRERHQAAIDKSCEGITFGAVKNIVVDATHIDGSPYTIDSWNYDVIYRLYTYIDTDFALLIHADGWVINPHLWRSEWLSYDFIGAPWPLPVDTYSYRDVHGNIVRVGNSVSLRSKRIMQLPDKLHLPCQSYYGNTNEDGFLCCHQRHILEKYKCKFAPIEEAIHFSKEHEIPENVGLETFAFHTLG